MIIQRDFQFQHAYQVDVLEQLPAFSEEARRYYPGARLEGGPDGLIVRVSPSYSGESWVGVFAFWDRSIHALSGVFSCPNENELCVISRGAGYIVQVQSPTHWSELPTLPIRQVLQLPEYDLVVFSDFTTACGVRKNGFAWKTARLAWDNVELLGVQNHRLVGTGFDPTQRDPVSFSIDLLTGAHEGGCFPPVPLSR